MYGAEVIKKESNFVTEVKLGETVSVDGPAKFTLLEVNSSGHKNRALISVIADRSVRIKKCIEEAVKSVNKWGLDD